MFPERSRAVLSTLLGTVVLAVSILSGCVACDLPASAKTIPAQHACCKQHAQAPSCHMPVEKAPATKDCQSHKIDLGSVEHSLQKSVGLDFAGFVEAPTSVHAAIAGATSRFEEGPPAVSAAMPDLLSLNSTFRI